MADSQKAAHIKKREAKHNSKIMQSIDRIKRLQSNLQFYQGLAENAPQTALQDMIVRQNKLLQILMSQHHLDATSVYDSNVFGDDLSDIAEIQRLKQRPEAQW